MYGYLTNLPVYYHREQSYSHIFITPFSRWNHQGTG